MRDSHTPDGDSGAGADAAGDRTDAPDCGCECADPGRDRVRELLADGRGGRVADDRGRMKRRDLAKVLATIGGLTAVGSLVAPLAGLTRVFEREYTGPIYSENVNLVDAEGERIPEDHLAEGEVTTVFPETHPGVGDAPTLLVRFPEDRYAGATELAFTVGGYAAYSKVCTHAGCMVSDVEDATLVCPCHLGKFDPLGGATVVGGPPPRALPQLPITLSSDGYLVATGDFEGPVGPGEG